MINESNTPCQHLEKCEIWQRFSSNSKYFWIKQYCEGPKKRQCARAKCKEENGSVPCNLLPNGKLLD